MSSLTAERMSGDIMARVTLSLSMIDRRKAGMILDRCWRERTWPAIAIGSQCSVTTAVKRFKQGINDLKRATRLVEGRLSSYEPCATVRRVVGSCCDGLHISRGSWIEEYGRALLRHREMVDYPDDLERDRAAGTQRP